MRHRCRVLSRRPRQCAASQPQRAVRDGKWKLLINANGSRPELYDIVADVAETTDLAAKEAKVVMGLSERALAWRKSLP